MKTYQIITKIKRIDDGEIFSINENGSYSMAMMKRDFPNSFTFEHDLKFLLVDHHDSFTISEMKTIMVG